MKIGIRKLHLRHTGLLRKMNIEHRTSNADGFVKSLKTFFGVIPAKAGIQCFQIVLDACLRRHDGILTFYEVVNAEHRIMMSLRSAIYFHLVSKIR